MTTTPADIRRFVAEKPRWRWGGLFGEDCTTFVGSWVRQTTGIDPAAGIRGSYTTREEADAIVTRLGGIEKLGDAMLLPHSFCRVQHPIDGDIGIVLAPTGFDADGAIVKRIPGIKYGPLWAVMSARGPQVKYLEFTGAAWRIA